MEILVNFCISKLDSIEMCLSRKFCAVRHPVTKFRRAVRMKTAIQDSKRSNTAMGFERLKTVSQRRGVDNTYGP